MLKSIVEKVVDSLIDEHAQPLLVSKQCMGVKHASMNAVFKSNVLCPLRSPLRMICINLQMLQDLRLDIVIDIAMTHRIVMQVRLGA